MGVAWGACCYIKKQWGIHDCQKVEMTQMSTNRQMDFKNMQWNIIQP